MEILQKKTKHKSTVVGMDEGMDEDVMIEIFLWLPVKSLIRFKRLSKRWHFLISHKHSYFRRDYLTNITTRGSKRIVGSYAHSPPPSIAGFFFQVCCVGDFYDRVRFLPTSTEFVKAAADKQGGGGGGLRTTLDTSNPFSLFSEDYEEESLDRFLLFNCLQYDPVSDIKKEIHILASSNGFLLCSLERLYPINYFLVNPVTREWTALPKPKIIEGYVEVGFVCKGDYPSLLAVEYTIVRATWAQPQFVSTTTLLIEIFSSGDDQWRQFTCSSDQPSRPFYLGYKHKPVIVNNSRDQAGDGIVIYFLARLKTVRHSVILVFDFKNKDDDQKGRGLLQMIETPGKPEEKSGNECDDHIAEFDGVIHCMRYSNTYMELWVLNRRSTKTSTGEWFLKHRVSLTKMMEKCPWIDIRQWKETLHIQGFHPMNPNLIFLTLDQKMVWCNFESGTLELVCDFRAHNLLARYFQYAYQWPCWPPLL